MICSNMDLEGIMLSEIRQRNTVWDHLSNTVWYHLYMELKKMWQTSDYTKKSSRLTDIENKLVATRREREREKAK